MKKTLVLFTMLMAGLLFAYSHDYFLLPDSFFLTKGQMLNAQLVVGDKFKDLEERKYQSSKTVRFLLLGGGKPQDLSKSTADSAMPVFSHKMESSGLAMIAMERNHSLIVLEKDKFLEYLNEEGLDSMYTLAEKMNKTSYREKYTRYLKTLVMVDKPSGSLYNEKLGQKIEILLLQNPYKMHYGDDMVAQVLFNGKPLKSCRTEVITRAANQAVFSEGYTTDAAGKIFFKLNRSGVWMVSLVHMIPSKESDADFESFWTSYTFGFRES